MELTEDFERHDAAIILAEDYEILRAEADANVRALRRARRRTEADLVRYDQVEESSAVEASRVVVLVGLARQAGFWDGRGALYDYRRRLVLRRVPEIEVPL